LFILPCSSVIAELPKSCVRVFQKTLSPVDLNGLIQNRFHWLPCTLREFTQRIERLFANID